MMDVKVLLKGKPSYSSGVNRTCTRFKRGLWITCVIIVLFLQCYMEQTNASHLPSTKGRTYNYELHTGKSTSATVPMGQLVSPFLRKMAKNVNNPNSNFVERLRHFQSLPINHNNKYQTGQRNRRYTERLYGRPTNLQTNRLHFWQNHDIGKRKRNIQHLNNDGSTGKIVIADNISYLPPSFERNKDRHLRFRHYEDFQNNFESPVSTTVRSESLNLRPQQEGMLRNDITANSDAQRQTFQFPDTIVKDGQIFYRHDVVDQNGDSGYETNETPPVNTGTNHKHNHHFQKTDDQMPRGYNMLVDQVRQIGAQRPIISAAIAGASIRGTSKGSTSHVVGSAINGGYFAASAQGYDGKGGAIHSHVHGTAERVSGGATAIAPNRNGDVFIQVDHSERGLSIGQSSTHNGEALVLADVDSHSTHSVQQGRSTSSFSNEYKTKIPGHTMGEAKSSISYEPRKTKIKSTQPLVDNLKNQTNNQQRPVRINMIDNILETVHLPSSQAHPVLPVETSYDNTNKENLHSHAEHNENVTLLGPISGPVLTIDQYPENKFLASTQRKGVVGLVTYAQDREGTPPGPGELLQQASESTPYSPSVSDNRLKFERYSPRTLNSNATGNILYPYNQNDSNFYYYQRGIPSSSYDDDYSKDLGDFVSSKNDHNSSAIDSYERKGYNQQSNHSYISHQNIPMSRNFYPSSITTILPNLNNNRQTFPTNINEQSKFNLNSDNEIANVSSQVLDSSFHAGNIHSLQHQITTSTVDTESGKIHRTSQQTETNNLAVDESLANPISPQIYNTSTQNFVPRPTDDRLLIDDRKGYGYRTQSEHHFLNREHRTGGSHQSYLPLSTNVVHSSSNDRDDFDLRKASKHYLKTSMTKILQPPSEGFQTTPFNSNTSLNRSSDSSTPLNTTSIVAEYNPTYSRTIPQAGQDDSLSRTTESYNIHSVDHFQRNNQDNRFDQRVNSETTAKPTDLTRVIPPGVAGSSQLLKPALPGDPFINVITVDRNVQKPNSLREGAAVGPGEKLPGFPGYSIPSGFRGRIVYNIKSQFRQWNRNSRRDPSYASPKKFDALRKRMDGRGNIYRDDKRPDQTSNQRQPTTLGNNNNNSCGSLLEKCRGQVNSNFNQQLCNPYFLELIACCC